MSSQPENYLSDVIGDMPEVSPVAETITQKVQNEREEQNPNAEKVPQQPKKRGRGRPRKDGTAPKASPNKSRLGGVASAAERDLAAQDAERLAAAAFVTELVEISGVAIAGDDARMQELEKMAMAGTWEKYFRSKNISDIPPGVALCLVMSQYYARVFTFPEAQPKVKKIRGVLKEKLSFISGFIKGRKNARALRRNDHERENNAGQAASEGVQSERD